VLVVVAGVAVTRVVATRGDPDSSDPGVLVVAGGAVYLAGYDVLEVDPSDGTSELILDDIFATDVAVVGDRLVIAGTNTLGGLHLPLPPPDERVTGEVEVED
jgi:hypothetical protein